MSLGVLLIGNYPPPYGGVPRYIENLAPFLANQGWDVHVLSTGHSGQSSGTAGYGVQAPLVAQGSVGIAPRRISPWCTARPSRPDAWRTP